MGITSLTVCGGSSRAPDAEVVGAFSTLSKANSAIDKGGFDCAAIDLNLHGESAVPIADRLTAEGKSFAIATGMAAPPFPIG